MEQSVPHAVEAPHNGANSLADTAAGQPLPDSPLPGQPLAWSAAPPEGPADEDLDLLADNRFHPSRLTVGLICAIAATLVFMGGVAVQKHYGSSSAAAGAGPTGALGAGGFGARAGYGAAGGFPGGQAGAGAAGGFGGGTGGAASGSTGSSAGSTTTPVVVGIVSKLASSSMVVKNLGGKSVNVKVPDTATISFVAGSKITKLATLKTGSTVSVAGTTASDGTVTATSVTVRS